MKTYITSITLILFFLLAGPQLVFSQGQEDRDPISFELVNAQGDDIVYIDNSTTSKGQTMRMVLLNNDLNPLIFSTPKTGKVGKDNYHFKLEIKYNHSKYFKKEVLNNIKLAPASAGIYQMAINTEDSENAYFYILITDIKSYILQPSTRKFIGLTGFKANSKSGPMGSVPIRLHYHYAHYQSDSNSSISNTFDSAIRIKNKNGLENIPIHAGLLGSQSVLNDGITSNSLTIGLENVAISDTAKIYYDTSTTIVISYKLELKDQAPWVSPWALTTKNQFNNSASKPIVKINNTPQPTPYWKAEKSSNGLSWTLTAQGAHSLSPKDVLKIELGGIVSDMPVGVSHIYVHYNNIEGYYDGFFSIPISKSYIYEHDQSVMVGTTSRSKIGSDPLRLHIKNGYSLFNGLYLNGEDTDYTILSQQAKMTIKTNAGTDQDIHLVPTGKVLVDSDLTIGGDISSATGNITDIGEITTRGEIKASGAIYAKGGMPGGDDDNNTGFAFKGGGGDDDSGIFSSKNGEVALYSDSRERLIIQDSTLLIRSYNEAGTTEVGKEIFKMDNHGKITYAKDRPNSVSGTVEDTGRIFPPYGTTDDWSIFVSANHMTSGDWNKEIVDFYVEAKPISILSPNHPTKKAWEITCYARTTNESHHTGTANYLLVRK